MKMKTLDLNKIYQGDALEVLQTFPDESVDMCITSPPYWGLRDYGEDEQLGLESTPEEFIDNLCNIFDEVKRCLRPHGTCWVNLGDTYANSGYGKGTGSFKNKNNPSTMTPKVKCDLPQKCLVQIPSRFTIEMTNRGWILRNEIIWHKPSCLPSPATDRYTVDFEKLFFFTKNRKYHFKQQFEPMVSKPHAPGNKFHKDKVSGPNDRGGKSQWDDTSRVWSSDRGRNKRTVWSINPASFKEAHFATYPPALLESPIDAGCPLYVCSKCGKAREEITEKVKHELSEVYTGQGKKDYKSAKAENPSDVKRRVLDSMRTENVVVGYTDCGCNEDFVPGVVLDPFIGSGTTAEIAMKQDKNWVGIDLNSDYIDIADKRLKPTIKEKKTREKASEFWE